jgi:hypothetical protein
VSGSPAQCKVGSTSVGVYCTPSELVCANFSTPAACTDDAPSLLCAWNTAAERCDFVADFNCSADSPDCFPADPAATITELSPITPRFLVSQWPFRPDNFTAQTQPDILTFIPSRPSGPFFDDPLWRVRGLGVFLGQEDVENADSSKRCRAKDTATKF